MESQHVATPLRTINPTQSQGSRSPSITVASGAFSATNVKTCHIKLAATGFTALAARLVIPCFLHAILVKLIGLALLADDNANITPGFF